MWGLQAWEASPVSSGERRPRIIVDAVGDSRLIEQAIGIVAEYGQVIMLGTPPAPYQADCTNMLKLAHRWQLKLIGTHPTTDLVGRHRTDAVITLELMSERAIRVGPRCSHTIAPADLNQAYEGLLGEREAYMGVVLDWENQSLPRTDYAS